MRSERAPTTILVVEDEAIVRDCLVTELQDAGYQVVAADTGEKVLAVLRDTARNIGWLFTDICLLGVIDGWRVADEFRLTHPFRPVVYATAYAPEQARQQLHGSYFFRKPYRPEQIVAAFRRLSTDMPAGPGGAEVWPAA